MNKFVELAPGLGMIFSFDLEQCDSVTSFQSNR
jgi:hypothetical protein